MIGGFEIFRVKGIPVLLHWTIPLLLVWLLLGQGWFLIGLALPFLGFLALHEAGHALVARHLGYSVRMIILTPVGGAAMVQLSLEDPRHESQIAMAGPMVNLVLASVGAVAWGLCSILNLPSPAWMLWIYWIAPNLMLGMLNLIPAFPMDGGRILRAQRAAAKGLLEATRFATDLGQKLAVALGILSFFMGGIQLLIVAVFLYFAAGNELRRVKMRQALSQDPSVRAMQEDADFSVGPPPYESAGRRSSNLLLSDIRKTGSILWQECRDFLN